MSMKVLALLLLGATRSATAASDQRMAVTIGESLSFVNDRKGDCCTWCNGTTATATEFIGRFGLTMTSEDATAMLAEFARNPSAVRTALESGIATGLGIASSMVEVTDASSPAAGRRVKDAGSSVVQMDYRITVPTGSSTIVSATHITSDTTASELMSGMNRAMLDANVSFAVASLIASTPVDSIVTMSTANIATDDIVDMSLAHKAPASSVSIVAGLCAVALFIN